jgi:hypothetical protein
MNKILNYISFSLLGFFSTFNFVFACIGSTESLRNKSLISIEFILFALFTSIGNIYIILSKTEKNKSIGKIIISVLLFTISMFIVFYLYEMATLTFC